MIFHSSHITSISIVTGLAGAGYHMVMTKKADCDVDKVHELLTRHVPEAALESMNILTY